MTDTYTPQPGDIGLTTIHGPVGWGIGAAQTVEAWAQRLFRGAGQAARYRHAYVVLTNGQIIEAEPGGARIRDVHEYDGAGLPTVYLRCPDQYRAGVASAARGLEAVPYSFLDYQAITLHDLHVPAPGLRDYIGDTGHMVCSQLADEAARRGGWHLFTDDRWPGYVSPAALYRLYEHQRRYAA